LLCGTTYDFSTLFTIILMSTLLIFWLIFFSQTTTHAPSLSEIYVNYCRIRDRESVQTWTDNMSQWQWITATSEAVKFFVTQSLAIPFTIGCFTPSIWASVRIGSFIDTLVLRVHLMGVLMGVLMIAVRTSGCWLTVSTVDESTSVLVAAAATSSAST